MPTAYFPTLPAFLQNNLKFSQSAASFFGLAVVCAVNINNSSNEPEVVLKDIDLAV